MLVKQELINRIKDYFDLNVYETKVWLALLGKGIASAGEIAEISRVPRSRTYDVLETLEKKGFTIVKIGKPVKYIGVKPNIILERLKSNVRRDAEEKINYFLKIKDTEEFANLEKLYEESINPVEREKLSAALRGKTNISEYLREMIQNSKKEIIICTDTSEVKSKIKFFKQIIAFLSKTDIKLKIALSGESEQIKQLEKTLGIKIKKTDIDAKFFIIDKKEILLHLSKNSEEELAIWLNSGFFANAFGVLFEKALEIK
ncbi:MAG TPA: helix-turn-helix domain-containing protein [Patescibacteria group bacterium]|nr:helix-turn-helix domain-containing protein [Patescibacteria group bacterium]